jgi:hypothetical protein
MAVHVFTNHLIYDSILRRTRLSAQRGTCPVAKKAIFKNCESNQCVICLANANFGLAGRMRERSTLAAASRSCNAESREPVRAAVR